MKKTIIMILALVLLFTGCTTAPEKAEEAVTIRVAALKGPTGMGMAQLMEKTAEENGVKYEFTLVNSTDEIPALMVSGQVDIAAAPTNLAALLYQKTQGGIQLAAVNTLGVLYILTAPEVTVSSVADLAGKTIVTSGQGATPEYALNEILRANGLEPGKDVTIDYRSEHAEVTTLLLTGKADIVLLPEPQVTAALLKNPDLRVALDMTEEWAKAAEKAGDAESVMAMGCLILRKEFAQAHPAAVEQFFKDYAASVEFINANPEEAGQLIEKHEIMPAAKAAEKAIPRCNIVCMTGEDLKPAVEGFLEALFNADPKSVGGALPADDFYYTGK